MNLIRLPVFTFGLLALLSLALPSRGAEINFAQGLLAGEVSPTTAILQARLTASTGLVDGDVPGAPGVARFEIDTAESFASARRTPWLQATPEGDFIVKHKVDGLLPGTVYHFRIVAGAGTAQARPGPAGRFRTLPAETSPTAIKFVLLSCLNYSNFRDGAGKRPAYAGPDRDLGYPALEPLRKLEPDFTIFAGDCVYYDHPRNKRAQTQSELRKKWHEQYVQPRFVSLFARSPTYWLKDDHDHRKDDSDATGDYAPSNALGIATFREQVPIVDPADPRAVTYRTHRIGRDLQLWFVEGRDYRSPNAMPPGPGKTLWGAEQMAWLKRTLKESDATFKILVSPTPMVGPDDATKKDNHSNPAGFKHEGEAFFAWLHENGIAPGRFFVVCGDRHWKYHSVHPTGFEEFCSGALNRENARGGRAPGNAASTDPEGLIRQPYKDRGPSGGFLQVAVQSAAGATGAAIEFSHVDDTGAVLYRHVSRAH